MDKRIRILSLNIGNPSLERAREICMWLEKREEDLFVLTETKESKGCTYIRNFFLHNICNISGTKIPFKCSVEAPVSQTGDLGVMIISKFPIQANFRLFPANSIYYSRQTETMIRIGKREIHVIGLYVPSRDRSETKIQRKKVYIEKIQTYIEETNKTNTIVMGDFNILERNHVPHYPNYFEWEYNFYDSFTKMGYIDAYRHCHINKQEYSWVGRTNNGYRYDHCFVSNDLKRRILECEYIHDTRNARLSDHSAISACIEL